MIRSNPDEIFSYRDLAHLLRERIRSGEVGPGTLLPSANALMRQYDVGREVVRQAVQVLRSEGLIDTEHGVGHRVRVAVERQRLRLQRGSTAVWRMPTPEERREHDVPEGVPVLVVTHGGRVRVYPGDRWELSSA